MTQTTEAAAHADPEAPGPRPPWSRRMSPHRAWFVAAVAFVSPPAPC
ncbi:hypothetical protein [Streptomyces sp. ISL-99]|nr:hypothetical protein [Streptomyces sp. ISL-99]